MSQSLYTLSKPAITYLCGLIRDLVSVSEAIDDLNLRTDGTFSSVKIDKLITQCLQDANTYSDSVVNALTHLVAEKIDFEPTLDNTTDKLNTLLLYSKNSDNNYTQYLRLTNELLNLGDTSLSLNEYLKTADADTKYVLKTTYDDLVTKVNDIDDLLGNATLNTNAQNVTEAINELEGREGVVVLTKEEYSQLVANGSVVLSTGETINYDANGLYLISNDEESIVITSTINASSTDSEVPTAKAVNDTCVHIDAENMLLHCTASGTVFKDFVDEKCISDFRAYHIVFNSLVSGTPCSDGFGTIYTYTSSLHKKAVIYDVASNAAWEITKLNGTWGTWQRVRSAVEDVPLTKVALPDGVDGDVFYKISNGIISVSIQGVTASCSVTIPNVPNIYQLSALVNPSGVQCGYAGVPALNTISIVINGSNAGYGSIIINT